MKKKIGIIIGIIAFIIFMVGSILYYNYYINNMKEENNLESIATNNAKLEEIKEELIENKSQDTTSGKTQEETVGKKKTLLYFGATWCGYCKLMEPYINQISNEMRDTVTVKKYDCDIDIEIASQYNITALPTIIILEEGEIINRLVGYREKTVIANALK